MAQTSIRTIDGEVRGVINKIIISTGKVVTYLLAFDINVYWNDVQFLRTLKVGSPDFLSPCSEDHQLI